MLVSRLRTYDDTIVIRTCNETSALSVYADLSDDGLYGCFDDGDNGAGLWMTGMVSCVES